MADHDSDTPQGTPRPTPDPHRGEPTPAPDAHSRPGPEGEVVRPDQQEELGPMEGLMEASAAEVSAEVTGSPEDQAEAERLGAEGEGVEAAQIFSIMLATAVTLGLAVFGVFFLVAEVADEKTVERDAVVLYPELREVQRVAAEMENYSRTDSLYRLPIGAAMNQVSEAYYAQQEGSDEVVPAPDNFSTLYLDAIRESEVGVREYELDALGYDSLIQREQTVPDPGVDLGTDTDADGSDVEAETDAPPTDEPEDR
jgi:hypothetical protein